jgi:serine/threonine protein kinase
MWASSSARSVWRSRSARAGWAAVYRAERVDGAFTQRVAVKLIDAALRSPDVSRRFRAERQILAALQHPHIVTSSTADSSRTAVRIS